ncbi:MAG TPA: hypothetical protein VFS24_08365, partial [Steroidobacteraceae bacterium]|nr:hypothetical protein [Steroidobacteraceae bacterium]
MSDRAGRPVGIVTQFSVVWAGLVRQKRRQILSALDFCRNDSCYRETPHVPTKKSPSNRSRINSISTSGSNSQHGAPKMTAADNDSTVLNPPGKEKRKRRPAQTFK